MSALREIAAHFGIDFDTKKLKEGGSLLESTISSVKDFAGALGAGLALGAIYHFVTGLTEEADALAKQAAAMGVSLKEMQEWNYAASMQGVSAETLQGVLAKLGAGKYDKGLAQLGITTKNTDGTMRSAHDLLGDVADALSEIKDPAERNRKAIDVLGKSYAKMMPLLADGSKGINELREEFEAMGGGFTDDFAEKADALGDNLDRLKLIWKNLMIYVVSSVLPALVTLSTRLVSLAKPIIGQVKNSKLLETGLIALGAKGFMFLSSKIGPLGKALKALTGHFFKVIVPLLILEDFLVFLAGGDSAIGRLIDTLFGKGAQDDFRKWITGVKSDFLSFIRQIKNAPLSLIEDWELFTTTLSKDMRAWGGEFGEILNAAGAFFMFFVDVLTSGWTAGTNKMGAAFDGFMLAIHIAGFEIEAAFVHIAAIIGDAFIELWNGIVKGAGGVLKVLDKIIPGVSAGDKQIDEWVKGQQGDADMAKMVEQAREQHRMEIAAYGDNVAARLNQGVAPGARPPVTINNNTNVTVPPGTPAQVAGRVGDAAQKGAQKGTENRVAKAALVPGGG